MCYHADLQWVTMTSRISSRTVVEEINESTENWKPPRKMGAAIFDALSSHPNVFDATSFSDDVDDEQDDDEGTWGGPLGMIVSGTIYRYRIHLPKIQQKYREMDCDEHFSVLSSGSIFCAYAEIEDIPVWPNMGHEFRELAQRQIVSRTPFKSPTIGPCPIHPDFYVVIKQVDPSQANQKPKFYEFQDDVIVVADAPQTQDIHEVVFEIFLDCQMAISTFYENAIERNALLDYEVEISSLFQDITERITGINHSSAAKFWKTRSYARQARESLAKVHTRIVEFSSALAQYQRAARGLDTRIQRIPVLAPVRGYFREMCDPEVDIMTPAMTSALNFFETELQLYGNIRSLIAASILGAVIGALLTGALPLLKK